VSQSLKPFRRVWFAVVLLLVAAPEVVAQSERKGGPESGTWAGEVGSASATADLGAQSAALLRFLSPRTAVVGAFAFSRQERTVTGGGSADFTSLALQVGVRRYTRTGLGLRPIVGGGLALRKNSFGGSLGTGDTAIGAYGEAGAAWFFNPHVSLGVLGGLNITGSDNAWTIGGTLARVTAAVYF
jgi:hypothetical protein